MVRKPVSYLKSCTRQSTPHAQVCRTRHAAPSCCADAALLRWLSPCWPLRTDSWLRAQVGSHEFADEPSTAQVALQPPEGRQYHVEIAGFAQQRLPAAALAADVWALGMAFWSIIALHDVSGTDLVRWVRAPRFRQRVGALGWCSVWQAVGGSSMCRARPARRLCTHVWYYVFNYAFGKLSSAFVCR